VITSNELIRWLTVTAEACAYFDDVNCIGGCKMSPDEGRR